MNWLKNLLLRFRIWRLKTRLRELYVAYYSEFDRRKGGHFMVQMTSVRMHSYAKEIDELLARLKLIDPDAANVNTAGTKLAAF